MFSRKFALVSLVFGLLPGVMPASAQQADQLRLNRIQVIGTHNSYHAGFAPSAARLWEQKNPRAFAGLDYRHQPLTAQLDSGVRQIELDVFSDSKGELFAHPTGPAMVAAANLPADPDFDPDG